MQVLIYNLLPYNTYLMIGLMLCEETQGMLLVYQTSNVILNSIDHSVVGYSSLNDIPLLPRITSLTIIHDKMYPLAIITFKLVITECSYSSIFVEIIYTHNAFWLHIITGFVASPSFSLWYECCDIES